MSVRVLGTNHTSFTVSNLDRTLGFFRDCPGFELSSKAPGHTIELIEYRAPANKGAVKARPYAEAAVGAVERYGDWDGVTLEFIEVPTK